MPAFLSETQDLAVKVVSVFPQNVTISEPTIYAAVLALDAATGRPLALIEGSTLTAIRTGAASGAATDLLARQDATSVGMFGSGVQARTQLEAVCTVRQIEKVYLFSIDRTGAEQFVAEMSGAGPIPLEIEIVDKASEAVEKADIICTATTSTTPVFSAEALQPGTHINAVGAFTPKMQEIGADTVRRSRVFVDSREAALDEAGDLIIPMNEGLISADHIVGELGEIVLGKVKGRTQQDQITFFKSVGVAVQDAIAAARAMQGALEQGLGTTVDF
jgi:ornithine cyclodeaminase/alanine dehydrogenase-like protein (mu-crystallin family)